MTAYDAAEVERLIAEAREDDARMTRAPWRRFGPWPQVTVYVDHEVGAQDDSDESEHVCDVYTSDQLKEPPPAGCIAEADAIARTRNNLHALADQLEAARMEIERLRARPAPDAGAAPAGAPDDLTDDDLSALERDAEHLPSSPTTLGELEPLLAEIRRHRAMVARIEVWAVVLETDTLGAGGTGVGPFIAAELRNRMKGESR